LNIVTPVNTQSRGDAAADATPTTQRGLQLAPLRNWAVEHPLHAKAVGQLAELVAPRLDAQRRGDTATFTKRLEKLFSRRSAIHHENMR